MVCPNCEHKNAKGANYCSNCGKSIVQVEMKKLITTSEIDDHLEKSLHSIEKKEMESLLKIEEKADQWIRNRLGFMSAVVGLLLLFLSILGIREFNDFRKTSRDAIALIKNHMWAIDSLKHSTNDTVNKELENLKNSVDYIKEKQKELEKYNSLQEKTQKLIAEARNSTKVVNELRESFDQRNNNLNKIQNSMYEIFIHCPEIKDMGKRKKCLEKFTKILQEAGFTINDANIGNITVNQTEVIYYNTLAEEQAKFISSILRDNLKMTDVQEPKFVQRNGRNPRELLVKLNVEEIEKDL